MKEKSLGNVALIYFSFFIFIVKKKNGCSNYQLRGRWLECSKIEVNETNEAAIFATLLYSILARNKILLEARDPLKYQEFWVP